MFILTYKYVSSEFNMLCIFCPVKVSRKKEKFLLIVKLNSFWYINIEKMLSFLSFKVLVSLSHSHFGWSLRYKIIRN